MVLYSFASLKLWRSKWQNYNFLTTTLNRNCVFNQKKALTSSSAKEEQLEERIANNYKSSRDIPFLFLPHTVNKPFLVHPTSTTVPKIFEKYKWLTKTVSSVGLPEAHYLNKEEPSSNFVKEFEKSFFHTVAYQKSYANKDLPRLVPERIDGLFFNFIRLSLLDGSLKNHLKAENSYLYLNPLVETHWTRNYKFYYSMFKPNYVLKTRNNFAIIEAPKGKNMFTLSIFT